ncbi:MAG: hypothetical protein R2909_18000 [Gemmatimonadales bacterium]
MRLRFPHPLLLLLGAVLVAALLTRVLPAGEYDRAPDPDTGRELVAAGTYHPIEAKPVSLPAAVLAVPRGIVSGADVLLVILMVGGVFSLLESTGALGRLVAGTVGRGGHPLVIITVVSAGFCLLGALENMYEEIVALVPVMLLLSRGLGFGSITALSISLGAAVIGATMSPINPFGVGLAMQLAELPPLAGAGIRTAMTVAALALWIGWTWRQTARDDVRPELPPPALDPPTKRDGLLLALAVLPFGLYVYGVSPSTGASTSSRPSFLVAAACARAAARLSLWETAERYLAGMAGMLTAGLYVGVARAISVVLTDGGIIDTIVHASPPRSRAPPLAAALGMAPVHALLYPGGAEQQRTRRSRCRSWRRPRTCSALTPGRDRRPSDRRAAARHDDAHHGALLAMLAAARALWDAGSGSRRLVRSWSERSAWSGWYCSSEGLSRLPARGPHRAIHRHHRCHRVGPRDRQEPLRREQASLGVEHREQVGHLALEPSRASSAARRLDASAATRRFSRSRAWP